MARITTYEFGRMTVDGRPHTSDLILYPDGRVQGNWFRKAGHFLESADIRELIRSTPNRIIVGTGASGRMSVDPDLEAELKTAGIALDAMPTRQAVEAYNRLFGNETDLAACFHLTC
ncbi:MAG: MTH938/NDUFAF3 family protein [Desulfobacterales bacterium]|nr:MTH938/NDUFAF3 family protein [Desulfobacterales bacterium]